MYEKFYSPIPDVDAYLERLGVPRASRLDKEYLDRLIYAHQCRIVFENLDIFDFHRPITLEIPALFQKIIVQKRGGYCFELNALFTQLLIDLGFCAHSCMCRILRGRTFKGPILHRGIIVKLEGKEYFCDVGYGGPQPPGAVLIENDCSVTLHGEVFHIRRFDDYWWTLSRTTSRGNIEDVLQFYAMPQDPVDFLTINDYCSGNPASVFTQKHFVNLRTPAGSRNILGDVYTCAENGQTITHTIRDDDEFRKILLDSFSLHIADWNENV